MYGLLQFDGIIDTWMTGGRTPLHVAAEKGNTECARMLRDLGGDSAAQDRNGRTPLDLAIQKKCVETARVFKDDIVMPCAEESIKQRESDSKATRKRLENAVRASQMAKRRLIAEKYKSRHPQVHKLTKESYDEKFYEALTDYGTTGSAEKFRALIREPVPGIIVFPIFSRNYCSLLIEELEHYQSERKVK